MLSSPSPPSLRSSSGAAGRRGCCALLARLAGTAVLTVGSIAACTPGSEGESIVTNCAERVASASLAVEVADQVRLLDAALVTCPSYSTLIAEMAKHPGIVGYEVATYVELRCARVDDESVREGPACSEVIVPVTAPATTVVDIVFVGETLDGRRIEIRPDADTPFLGDVPAAVQQSADIALESGCEGVLAQRDFWALQIGDPSTGDEASVYAQHAQNVADYISCESIPLDIGTAG